MLCGVANGTDSPGFFRHWSIVCLFVIIVATNYKTQLLRK